jgi:glycosyltransferase involved in cell wall biosynthesis
MSRLTFGIDALTPGLSLAPRAGGMRMYVTTIVRAMHDCDDDAELVLFENPHAPLLELRSLSRLRLTQCPFVPRSRAGRVVYQNSAYPFVVRSAHIDALLATCNVVPFGTPVPTVVVVQSLNFFGHPTAFGAWRRRYLRLALADSVKRATAVICLSEASKRELANLTGVDPGKVHVVYHGLPPAHNVVGTLMGRQRTQPYILNVSSLHGYKNVIRLIEAYAQIRNDHHIPQRLRIIGYEAEYTAQDVHRLAAELGVADCVDFLGPIGHEDLPTHYAAADLFVYPSLYETFGLPPLEAMAAGCPVVAANSSSIPEIVGDAAELVDPIDVAAIASGMLHVLTDATWRNELITRGRSRAAQFTWERTASRILEIMRRAAGAAGK